MARTNDFVFAVLLIGVFSFCACDLNTMYPDEEDPDNNDQPETEDSVTIDEAYEAFRADYYQAYEYLMDVVIAAQSHALFYGESVPPNSGTHYEYGSSGGEAELYLSYGRIYSPPQPVTWRHSWSFVDFRGTEGTVINGNLSYSSSSPSVSGSVTFTYEGIPGSLSYSAWAEISSTHYVFGGLQGMCIFSFDGQSQYVTLDGGAALFEPPTD